MQELSSHPTAGGTSAPPCLLVPLAQKSVCGSPGAGGSSDGAVPVPGWAPRHKQPAKGDRFSSRRAPEGFGDASDEAVTLVLPHTLQEVHVMQMTAMECYQAP